MAFNPQYTSVGDRRRARDAGKANKAKAEREAWENRQEDLLFELRINEATRKAEERAVKDRQAKEKKGRIDRYGELKMLESDVDEFLSMEFDNEQEKQNELEVLNSRYSSDQRIQAVLNAAVSGREDVIPSVIMNVEEDLMRRGEIEPVKRSMAVTKSGKIAAVPEGSTRYMRDLNDHEKFAIDQGVDPNTPEFDTFVDMHRQGKFEEAEFIVPGKGPQTMERWRGESMGLSTTKQYDWQQDQSEKKKSELALDKDARDARKKMRSNAETFKTGSSVALDNIEKAQSMLEIALQQGVDITDPKSFWESSRETLTGGRFDITRLRDELDSFLTAVKSNVALDKMAEMKSQSATGATGFGSMQKNELDLITGALGRLDLENNTARGLLDSLGAIQNVLSKANSGFIPGEVQSMGSKNPWGEVEGAEVMFMGGDPDDPDNWEVM